MKLFSRDLVSRNVARMLGLTATLVGAALFLNGQLAFGQATEPLVGNWVLDRGKSTFEPDSTMQGRTVMIEAKDGGISFVQKTVTDRGNTVQSDFVAKFDGKDAPISASQLDTVALKRVDANTVERTGKVQGKQVEMCTMKLSNGGKTLTIITKGSVDGIDYSSTQVFQKE
jgi:hypothetical protein